MAASRTGIWFVGAKGGVASTAIVGLMALKRGLIAPAGLVSELPRFSELKLRDWSDFVVGGHEVRDVSLAAEAERLHTDSRVISSEVLTACKEELEAIDGRIRPGTVFNSGPVIEQLATAEVRELRETPRQAIDRLRDDMQKFVAEEKLDDLIVVNVSSTEPPTDVETLPKRFKELAPLLEKPDCPLRASSIYAIAALEAGFPMVNFTPSAGTLPEAIAELAETKKACHTGRDGKTGETLLKSVLAPMFARRNLQVKSWVGHNIFGNLDGKVLDDPTNKAAKVKSKDQLLSQILQYSPQTLVSIEYIKSMGDWKTAWDHIHFNGFLDTPMTMQFIWQGCDSLLAAPLVLDLVRFTERARRAGETGVLTFLNSFFKSPMGTDEHDFTVQFQMLEEWTDRVSGSESEGGENRRH